MSFPRIEPDSGSSLPYNFNNVSSSPLNVSADPVFETRLISENQLWSEKAFAALKLGVKIIFFPITILAYLIYRSCSHVASSRGLGNEADLKVVDHEKRSELISLGGQEILFGFQGKSLLEGMFFQADASNPHAKTVLVCAGSNMSYENYTLPMVKALKSMGHNVMVFNYEGFGKSEGTRSEEGVYRSVEAAYQYLKQEKNCLDQNIVGWGYSLGSAAVSDLASKHKVDIVIDRGFSSMSEVAYNEASRGLRTIAKIIFLVGAHFDNLSKLKKLSGNVLIAQGEHDETMVKKRHGEFLKNALSNNQYAIFIEVNSAHEHTDQVWFGVGKDRAFVEEFLNRVHI